MNEWLLIVMLVTQVNAQPLTMSMIRLPNQQACIDAGEEALKLRPQLTRGRYSCTEIKGSGRMLSR